MSQSSQSARTPVLVWALAGALLLWMVVVITLSQWRMSPTFDEQNHVTRGIAILRTGDFRLSLHHPPLANILQGLPVAGSPNGFSTDATYWRGTESKDFLNIWDAAAQTIWHNPTAGLQLIRQARVMVLLFTLLLGVVIFAWARELFGPWGGLLALALYALDPNMIAHSGVATTDMAAVATIALAVYLLRLAVLRPSRGHTVLAGLGIGLALTAKFSAFILVPIAGLLLLIFALWPQGETTTPIAPRIGRAFGHYVLLGVLALLVVWAVYGFKVEPLGGKPGQKLSASASAAERIPVPALQYLRGLKTVATEAEAHPAYLLGRTDNSGKGWWYYFPVAIAAKTPIPELFAILGMLVLLAVPKTRAQLGLPGREVFFLLLPVGIYLLAALGVLGISLNLGVRHILPIYPFLLILAGGWAVLRPATRWYRPALVGVFALQLFSVATCFPNFLTYFNEAAGGPNNGWRVLIDSNYDWGQDLGALAKLQREDGLPPLYLSYFGTTPPEAYGLKYVPVAGFGRFSDATQIDLASLRGFLAVSMTDLAGGPGYTGTDYRPLLKLYQENRHYDVAGNTIVVFYLPPEGLEER